MVVMCSYFYYRCSCVVDRTMLPLKCVRRSKHRKSALVLFVLHILP